MLATLFFSLQVFLYPVITGPLAALIYLRVLRPDDIQRVRWFWLGLLVVNALGFFFLIATSRESLIDPGFFSCLVTPISAVLSALVLRFGGRRGADKWGGKLSL